MRVCHWVSPKSDFKRVWKASTVVRKELFFQNRLCEELIRESQSLGSQGEFLRENAGFARGVSPGEWWVCKGSFSGRMDSFKLSVAPHRIHSFLEEGKGVNTGEWFFGNFGLNTENLYQFKRKVICNFNSKQLIFLCNLEVTKSPYKFQHSVGRVFKNGGQFDLFLENILTETYMCIQHYI